MIDGDVVRKEREEGGERRISNMFEWGGVVYWLPEYLSILLGCTHPVRVIFVPFL